MFGNNKKEKDQEILVGDDVYTSADSGEEIEYYDMSAFETKILRRLDVLESKIDTVLHEVEDNQHRLKGIQFQFTRQLIMRVIKLVIIAFIVFYVYNKFISPILIGASNKYHQAERLLNRFDAASESTDSISEKAKNTWSNIGDSLNQLRPGQSADKAVEN